MARLLLAWMSTEAVKTQSPVLVLGNPLTEFMCKWDMQDEAIALVVIERGSAIRWIGSLALCFSSSRRTEGRTTRHGSGTPSSNRGTGPPQGDHCAEASSSPGGKEENTGSASKLSYRLTMGSVEVSSIDPVKLVGPNRVPHTVRLMTSGQQCPNDAGEVLPRRVPDSKGDRDRYVGGRVCISNSCPKLIFSLFGKGDKPGCRNVCGIDSGFRHRHPFAVIPTKQKAGLQRPGAGAPRPAAQEK